MRKRQHLRRAALAAVFFALGACSGGAAPSTPDPTSSTVPPTHRVVAQVDYRLRSIALGPFTDPASDPTAGSDISEADLRAQIEFLAPSTRGIRTYGCEHGLRAAGKIGHELGLEVTITAWIGRDPAANWAEFSCAVEVARAGEADAVLIGSEALLRGDVTAADLATAIRAFRWLVPGVAVAAADSAPMLAANPAVVRAGTFVALQAHPFWEGAEPKDAIAALDAAYRDAQVIAKGREVRVAETGWPTDGDHEGATVSNAVRYDTEVIAWAEQNDIDYALFEAFDEPWKANQEPADVGDHWGIWTSDMRLKPGMDALFRTPAELTPITTSSTTPSTTVPPTTMAPTGEPAIAFTAVPLVGADSPLEGRVSGVVSNSVAVAVYIKVGNGWWTKPYWAEPLTAVAVDGTFACDVVTGGNDGDATEFAVFLVPAGADVPLAGGEPDVPGDILRVAIAESRTTR